MYHFCLRTNFIDISTYGNLLFATVFVTYRTNEIFFLVRYRAKSYYFNTLI